MLEFLERLPELSRRAIAPYFWTGHTHGYFVCNNPDLPKYTTAKL